MLWNISHHNHFYAQILISYRISYKLWLAKSCVTRVCHLKSVRKQPTRFIEPQHPRNKPTQSFSSCKNTADRRMQTTVELFYYASHKFHKMFSISTQRDGEVLVVSICHFNGFWIVHLGEVKFFCLQSPLSLKTSCLTYQKFLDYMWANQLKTHL